MGLEYEPRVRGSLEGAGGGIRSWGVKWERGVGGGGGWLELEFEVGLGGGGDRGRLDVALHAHLPDP